MVFFALYFHTRYNSVSALRLIEGMISKAVRYNWRITPLEVKSDYGAQTEEIRQRKVKNILVFVSNEDILKKIIKEVQWRHTRFTLLDLNIVTRSI